MIAFHYHRERREREASRSHGSQHSQGNAIEALQAGLVNKLDFMIV